MEYHGTFLPYKSQLYTKPGSLIFLLFGSWSLVLNLRVWRSFSDRRVYSAGTNYKKKRNPDVILPVKLKLYRQNKSRSYSAGKT